jgi:hypothetical protein
MDPSTLNQQLWLQYLAALQQQITLQGAPQIVNPYMVWDWGGTGGAMSGLPMAQYLTLDQVPQTPSSDTSSYGSKPGFGETYNLFLQMLDQTPGSSDPQYEALQQDVTDASNNLTVAIGNATTAYANFQSNTQTTEAYRDWLQNEGSGYQAKITLAKGTLTTAQTHLQAFLASRTNSIAKAITQYGNNLTAVSDPNNPLDNSKYPGWTMAQQPYQYVMQITNNNFGADATRGAAKSFTLTQLTESYNYQRDWASANVSFVDDFFGIEGGGSYSKVDTSAFTSEYAVTFSFQDLTTVGVTPGAWYTPGLAGVYQNGPFFEGYSGFTSGSDTYFFGPGGQLARQIIGPFFFGASGGSESSSDNVQFAAGKVTAQSNGNWPYIVAVVSGWVVNPPD